MKIEFFWDIGSTNTYFALRLIRPLVARYGAELVMHPFNLGYVFRYHKYVLAEEPQAKLQNRGRDLRRWAEKYQLGFRMPDTFPIKTSRALRGALVARELDVETAYVDRLFTRYWEENDASISEYEGIARVANEIEVDPGRFSRCGEKDNFWTMGDTGPCGPCSEIFYDHGPEIPGGPPGSTDPDADRYVEIWNLVFMQYERSPGGELESIALPSVDTGMVMESLYGLPASH